jgi:hypothetical protein
MNVSPQLRRIGRLLAHVRRVGVAMTVHTTPVQLRDQLGRFHVIVKNADDASRVVSDVDLDVLEVWASGAARAAHLGHPLPSAPWS